jgi:hypothetical protein
MTDTQPLLAQQFEVLPYETLAARDPALGPFFQRSDRERLTP